MLYNKSYIQWTLFEGQHTGTLNSSIESAQLIHDFQVPVKWPPIIVGYAQTGLLLTLPFYVSHNNTAFIIMYYIKEQLP